MISNRDNLNKPISKVPDRRSTVRSCFIKFGEYLKEFKNDSLYEFKNFEFLKLGDEFHVIGSGAFGDVFLAKNKKDGKYYAIKQMEKERVLQNGGNKDLIMREISIHRRLIHDNIVRLYSHYEDETHFYLVMDYVNKGTLYQTIKLNNGLTEKEAFRYFIQVVIAVNFLHENNLIHRDLKPENLLIDDKDQVKLCDFGWCVELKVGNRVTFCGTFEYMAPELIKELPYNHAVDVWSLGVLLYELIYGYSPFRADSSCETDDYTQIFKNILKHNLKMDNSISPECADLIQKLLALENKSRIKVKDIFIHPWVKSFEEDYKLEKLKKYEREMMENDSKIKEIKEDINVHSLSVINNSEGTLNKSTNNSVLSSNNLNYNYNKNKKTKPENEINIKDFETFNNDDSNFNYDMNMVKNKSNIESINENYFEKSSPSKQTFEENEFHRKRSNSNNNFSNRIIQINKNDNTNKKIKNCKIKLEEKNKNDEVLFQNDLNNITNNISKIFAKYNNADYLYKKIPIDLSKIEQISTDKIFSHRDLRMDNLCIEIIGNCDESNKNSLNASTISKINVKDKKGFFKTEETELERINNSKQFDNKSMISNVIDEYIDSSNCYIDEKDSSSLNNYNCFENKIFNDNNRFDIGESNNSHVTKREKQIPSNLHKTENSRKSKLHKKVIIKESSKIMNNNKLGIKNYYESEYNTVLSTETCISMGLYVSKYEDFQKKQNTNTGLSSVELLERAKEKKQNKLNRIHDFGFDKRELNIWDKLSNILNPFKCDK